MAQITIPASFTGIDSDQYAPGTPGSSFLGQRLAQNDRWLHATLKRSHCEAFPLIDDAGTDIRPTVSDLTGTDMMPWHVWGTPGVRGLKWILRAKLANAETFIAAPYIEGVAQYRAAEDSPHAFTIAGTAAYENYEIPAPMHAGPQSVGLVLYAGLSTVPTSVVNGKILARTCSSLTSTTGANTFSALQPAASPTIRAVVRIVDAAAAGNPVTGWFQIVGVSTNVALDDRIHIHGEWTLPNGTLFYEIKRTSELTIESISCMEEVLAGSANPVYRNDVNRDGYSPQSDNSCFSDARFTASFFASLGANFRHFKDSRCRVVAHHRYAAVALDIGGPPGYHQVAEYYSDCEIGVGRYYICTYWSRVLEQGTPNWWTAEIHDSAATGGLLTTGPEEFDSFSLEDERPIGRRGMIRFVHPFATHSQRFDVAGSWAELNVGVAGLPVANRVFRIYGINMSTVARGFYNSYYRGCTIVAVEA